MNKIQEWREERRKEFGKNEKRKVEAKRTTNNKEQKR